MKKSSIEVAIRWNGSLISVERFHDVNGVVVGSSRGAHIPVFDSSIPKEGHKVVEWDSEKAWVRNAPWMNLKLNGVPAKEDRVGLGDRDQAEVTVGSVTLQLALVDADRPPLPSVFNYLDKRYTAILLALFALQIGFVGVVINTPEKVAEDDIFSDPNRFKEIIVKQIKKKKEQKLASKKAGGPREAKEEGLFGKKELPKEDKISPKRGAPVIERDKRDQNVAAALTLLKKLGLRGDSGKRLGAGGLNDGADRALSGLRGSEFGAAGGHGGMGTRGTGVGGGGNAIGLGGLGSGSGTGFGGAGDVELGGHGRSRVKIIPGNVIYEGSLTREEIQRVVDKFMSQIKFCYEREIQKIPNLEGKIIAHWVITGDGHVQTSSVAESTMGNAPVEQCVLKIVNRMVFPKPRGGGIVKVNYPFVFSAAGV
jgi:hypothetical protein